MHLTQFFKILNEKCTIKYTILNFSYFFKVLIFFSAQQISIAGRSICMQVILQNNNSNNNEKSASDQFPHAQRICKWTQKFGGMLLVQCRLLSPARRWRQIKKMQYIFLICIHISGDFFGFFFHCFFQQDNKIFLDNYAQKYSIFQKIQYQISQSQFSNYYQRQYDFTIFIYTVLFINRTFTFKAPPKI
eukprot:TRINITY_DN3578_c0_g2_i1.p1 TRINITY_DN3578_c0_g2~~TRINITY_DN3578_c0_g2_i1.p1  ORF type:complete len:189 (-),score=-18.75 TRINITY_DN3578_c0_g2_i1:414-980(-)